MTLFFSPPSGNWRTESPASSVLAACRVARPLVRCVAWALAVAALLGGCSRPSAPSADAGGASALWLGDATPTSSNYTLASSADSCIVQDRGRELRRYDCGDDARRACFVACGRRFVSEETDWDAAMPLLLSCTDNCDQAIPRRDGGAGGLGR